MKTVWLLGDSIRINYQHVVMKQLKGRCTVCAPAENGRFAKYTLAMLDHWTDRFPRPDVIHWNCGLWDTMQFHEGQGPLFSDEAYLEAILQIYDILDRIGGCQIFATTTPVVRQTENAFGTSVFNEDIRRRNELVKEALRCRNAEINDLYGAMFPQKERFICDDGIHLNEAGMLLCGTAAAELID